jgi:hypothetical protein
MPRFMRGFLASLQPAPERLDRDQGASPAGGPRASGCKQHLRALCEGVTLKADLIEGWGEARDGAAGRLDW